MPQLTPFYFINQLSTLLCLLPLLTLFAALYWSPLQVAQQTVRVYVTRLTTPL